MNQWFHANIQMNRQLFIHLYTVGHPCQNKKYYVTFLRRYTYSMHKVFCFGSETPLRQQRTKYMRNEYWLLILVAIIFFFFI